MQRSHGMAREWKHLYGERHPIYPDIDIELPLEDEMPEMFNNSIIQEYRRWQRGCRPEAIREDSMIIQSKYMEGVFYLAVLCILFPIFC